MDPAHYVLIAGPVVLAVGQQLPDRRWWKPVKVAALVGGGGATIWALWRLYRQSASWA